MRKLAGPDFPRQVAQAFLAVCRRSRVGKLPVAMDPQRWPLTPSPLRTRERLLRAARAIRVAAHTALIEWKGVRHEAGSSTITSHITFNVEVEEDTEDGGYVASCVNLPGCFSQGATEEEAVRNIVEAIAGVMEARMERHLRERPLHPPGDTPDPSRPHRHELVISA